MGFQLWRSGLRIWGCCSCGVGQSCGSDSVSAWKLPHAVGAAKGKEAKKQETMREGRCTTASVCKATPVALVPVDSKPWVK